MLRFPPDCFSDGLKRARPRRPTHVLAADDADHLVDVIAAIFALEDVLAVLRALRQVRHDDSNGGA
jgi:hypothetical protein